MARIRIDKKQSRISNPIEGKKNAIPTPEQKIILQFRQKFANALITSSIKARSSIAAKLGKTFGTKRDLYENFGYPSLDDLNYEHYAAVYRRQDIAARIIDAIVDGAWQKKPEIVEDKEKDTQWEKDCKAIVKKHKLWSLFARVCKLVRLGRFGILLLGFNDIQTPEDLQNPVEKATELLYIQPYGEGSVQIEKWDTDVRSPNYNKPLLYKVTIEESEIDKGQRSFSIHYSRVIHVAEGLLESNVFGTPVLERVYNRLLNLELILGSDAEGWYQSAFPGYAFVADEDAAISMTSTELEAEIDLFVHDFKRYMKLIGLKVEKLASDVADPSNHVDAQLRMISIATGIPKRILEGSERGELASGQDEGHWNDKLESYQGDFLSPFLIEPFFDRMVMVGVMEGPLSEEGKYEVMWPDLSNPTDKDRAEIGRTRAAAIKDFLSTPGADTMMMFEDFLEYILDLNPADVKKMIDKAEQTFGTALEREEELRQQQEEALKKNQNNPQQQQGGEQNNASTI